MAEIISSKIRTVDNIVFRVGEINPNNNNERFADYDLENNQNKPLDADIQGIIDNAYGGKYTNKSFRNYNLGEYVKAAISVLPLVSANVVKHELYTPKINKDDKNRIFYKDAVYEQSDGTHYYVPKAGEIIIHQIKTLFGRGLSHFCNLLMTGESGFGKTQFAKLLGKILNVDIVKIDMSAVDEKLDVLGYIELINKDGVAVTQWTFNDFIQRIAQGNCLVILDELDKCEPKNASILNPLLRPPRPKE
jgi:Cdc6-like AAA superfamily ATPase